MIINSIVNVTTFTMYYANEMLNNPKTQTVPIFQQTNATYINLVHHKLQHNPSWFRMKLRIFHTIMFTHFLLGIAKEFTIKWSTDIACCAISPFLPFTSSLIYMISILSACSGLLLAESANIFTYKPPTLSDKEYNEAGPMIIFSQAKFSHPLPQSYCVFSGVALLSSFIGWLLKIGKRFGGLISSMHQIGLNTIYLLELKCLSTTSIIKEKTKPTRKRCYMNIQRLFRLLMFIMLCPTKWYAAAFNLQNKTDAPINKEYLHDVTWDISEEELLNITDWGNGNTPAIHTVTDIEDAMCFTTTTTDDINPLILHNTDKHSIPDGNMSFNSDTTEFGTDNCATHHICSLLNLFTDMRPAPKIGVTGVAGSLMASGIGTVQFTVTDDEGKRHSVKLRNVIYLPESAKNLISISQWSKDMNDDCGIISRGTYSTFMWDNDKYKKQIQHPPTCPIPLMAVNEDDAAFVLHTSTYLANFPDNDILLPDGAPQQMDLSTVSRTEGDTNLDKQSKKVPSNSTMRRIPNGATVWHATPTKRQIAIVIRHHSDANTNQYTIRPLNSKICQTVDAADVTGIAPAPADIPDTSKDIDSQIMTECLSEADLEQLWSGNIDSTINKNERLALYWHHRLRHAPLTCLHRLATRGVLPKAILLVRKLPLCAACAFATAHRRGWRTKSKSNRPIRKSTHDAPGKGTSCDHIVSHQPGLIPQSTGTLTHTRFWGSVLFVDHHSDFLYNHLITGTTSQATLESKQAYERLAAAHGVHVESYHADNLRFNDNNFKGDCIKNGQTISYCGVGAHHQNAVAESKIKTVCYGARTILLHAKRKWPEVIKTILWPYAMQSIVERHNRLSLDANGRSPLEKFSRTADEIDPTDFHTWGCPTYVLEEANQGAIGTPKWEPRSHAGIYLGHSPCHAGSVALVLNLRTGNVSPQFHVVYDDEFSTVPYLAGSVTPPNWENLVKHSSEHSVDNNNALSKSWLFPHASSANINSVSEGAISSTTSSQTTPAAPEGAPDIIPPTPATTSPSLSIPQNAGEDIEQDNFINIETIGLRRSTRHTNRPDRMSAIDPLTKEIPQKPKALGMLILAAAAFITQDCKETMSQAANTMSHCFQSRMIEYEDYLDRNFDGTRNSTNPLAQVYITSKANNEVYTLKEMLQEPDRLEFLKAMKSEVTSLFEEKIWKLVPRQEMTKHYADQRTQGKTIDRQQIMMIWSFKRKRHPDGSFNKCKARLCCHGGQQQWGVNYWDTYAPVVSWSSVRILLTLAKLHNFHTKSVDFVQAYPQANIKYPIYLKPPAGIVLNDNNGQLVLKLLKNLYGLKDAGRTWFEHLSYGLIDMGFKATSSDPCIFIRNSDIIILYVDDCVIISKTEREAEHIFSELENRKYKLTDEGSMEEYLGIQIDHNTDGSFRMSQPFLIQRIIEFIPGMTEARSAKSPACSSVVLTKEIDGEPRKEQWNYRAIVGMLNYLVNCTHPELSFAVHQCARFCNDPKRVHEQAVKRIIRYLISTQPSFTGRDKAPQGILFKPDNTKSIDTYVDASFAGEWNTSWSDEPSSVMSRTGYVILYANCPIIWSSKLQTEIALSTTESEYIALSQSLRDVIPLIGLLRELQPALSFITDIPTVHCTIFEDNKGCIDLVNVPKIRPRTKHIALKYHHFRSFVRNNTISIQYIDTTKQIADIFTKALNDAQFAVLRNMLVGDP